MRKALLICVSLKIWWVVRNYCAFSLIVKGRTGDQELERKSVLRS